MSLKSFSAFIVLKKYQFTSKSMRMVQLVYQIGVLILIKIPSWGTTFWASHHQNPFWELCDVRLTSYICTNLSSKLRYWRISMWIPDWCNKVHLTYLFPKSGTFTSMLDRFQIGFFYDYSIYTQFGKTKPVLYFNKNIGAASIIHSFSTNVYSTSDVINKDAFLMMMCPQFCLPVGFLCVRVLFTDGEVMIPSLAFGNNRVKVRRCRCRQVLLVCSWQGCILLCMKAHPFWGLDTRSSFPFNSILW